MINKRTMCAIRSYVLSMILVLMIIALPASAGSAVVGSVAGSINATVGGQALLPNTTIFSGDSVQVRDGIAVLAVGNTGRMILGHDTVASFLRDSNAVTVILSQGNVSVVHAANGTAMQIKTGSVSVAPTAGFKTLGEVAMLNGSVVISAKEGALDVSDHGATRKVAKGQTIVIAPQAKDAAKGGGGWRGGTPVPQVVTLGGTATMAILEGIGIGFSNDAKSSLNKATEILSPPASPIIIEASPATAAQSLLATTGNLTFYAGCFYNAVTTGLPDSPYVPPTGSCNNPPPGPGPPVE